MKNKKIIITLITLGVLLIAYIFYLVFRSEPIVTPLDNQNLPIGNLPGFIWLLIIYGWLVYSVRKSSYGEFLSEKIT